MSDENVGVYSSITGRLAFQLSQDGDKTFVLNAVTGKPVYVIDGKIGGDTVETMTTAERTAITPEAGQLIFDTTLGLLFVGDGSTQGGVAVGSGGGGDYIAGRWIDITGGATISEAAYEDIETVDVSGASPSVTMKPGHAYSINATAKPVTLNTEVFATSKFGKEGHLQIFVAGTGYVQTGANVYLKEPLEPDSINNCTVRFHGGSATISVEDHIGGYIVVSSAGSADGSLPYGLASAGSSYIAFNDTLAGIPINMGGVVTNGEKHVVGNGYADTILTGGVSCTSNTTFVNLTLSGGAVVENSLLTFDDGHFSPDSVTGAGTLTINRGAIVDLTGNTNATPINPGGGVVFSGSANIYPSAGSASAVHIDGGTFTYIDNGGVLHVMKRSGNQSLSGNATIDMDGGSIRFDGNTYLNGITYKCGTNGFILYEGDVLTLENCVVSCSSGRAVRLAKAQLNISNCSFEGAGGVIYMVDGGTPTVTFGGSNAIVQIWNSATSGTVTISGGASITLTSSIVPGGGITVMSGGCIINGSTIAAGTYTSIDSNGSATV